MKLTKKDRQSLENILFDLEKVERFIMADKTIVAKISNLTNAKENTWVNQETGESAYTFNKQIGSDLCYLDNAIRKIKYALAAETIKKHLQEQSNEN